MKIKMSMEMKVYPVMKLMQKLLHQSVEYPQVMRMFKKINQTGV